MQFLNPIILEATRKEKMQKLESELKNFVKGSKVGERIECPFCHYVSKNNKFSAVVFEDGIKCFACGKWRRI